VLKRTLQDSSCGEEVAMVLMPDSPLEEVDSLLSLLYTGSCAQTEGLGALLRALRVRILYMTNDGERFKIWGIFINFSILPLPTQL
jgi:hypothetical protein